MANDHGSSGTKATFFSMRKFRMQKCGEMIRESFLLLQGALAAGQIPVPVPHSTSTPVLLLWLKGCGWSIHLVLFSECSSSSRSSRCSRPESNTAERDNRTCGAEVALLIPLWRIPGLQAAKCFSTPHLPLVASNISPNHIQE